VCGRHTLKDPSTRRRVLPRLGFSAAPCNPLGLLPVGELHPRLRTRRYSNPRKPNLSSFNRSTFRLFSSLISTLSLANSSRSRFSTAPMSQSCRAPSWVLEVLTAPPAPSKFL
jgi:hypothetical protein